MTQDIFTTNWLYRTEFHFCDTSGYNPINFSFWSNNLPSLADIKAQLPEIARKHGFQDVRVSDIETGKYYQAFSQWVEEGNHGSMSYLERNQDLRQHPDKLHPNTCRVISFRFDYLPNEAGFTKVLKNTDLANISRYALGRDYHKLIRKKLQAVAQEIAAIAEQLDFRVFVDSAPVLETSFAEKSGLGWKGKHTLTINQDAGSWFFLGEIFVNIPLEVDSPVTNQCGQCSACINLCPTGAIVAPYKVDARRCISYLTIENSGSIPEELRPLMGNRIYGCDDCQLACPWNRYANLSQQVDFQARNQLDQETLHNLFSWSEQEFYTNLQGSPIRRIGYDSWLRNIAVALGNASSSAKTIALLENKLADCSDMVAEHINWAIAQQNMPDRQLEQTKTFKKTKQLIRTIEKMMPRDA